MEAIFIITSLLLLAGLSFALAALGRWKQKARIYERQLKECKDAFISKSKKQ